jgi:S1-C subfamily serine protease
MLTDQLRKQAGVPAGAVGIYIDNVFDPSPATRAGIQVGDILGLMDGQQIANVYDFQRKLYELGVGSSVKLNLLRGRRVLWIDAEITARPREATTR